MFAGHDFWECLKTEDHNGIRMRRQLQGGHCPPYSLAFSHSPLPTSTIPMLKALKLHHTQTVTPAASRCKRPFLGLRIKLMLGCTLVCGVVFSGAYYWFYNYSTQKALERIRDDLVATLEAAANEIDGDILLALAAETEPRADGYTDDPRYWEHVEFLAMVEYLEPRAFTYSYIAGPEANTVYFIGSGSAANTQRDFEGAKFLEYYEPKTRIYEGLTEQITNLEPYQDSWGYWISGYTPIFNAEGEAVAALGMDFQADYVLEVQQGIRQSMAIAFLITYIAAMVLTYVLAEILTRPITELTRTTEKISDGVYDHNLAAFQRQGLFQDEISRLAKVFEVMIGKIQQREADLAEANRTLEQQVQQRTGELQEKNTQLQQTLQELQHAQAHLVQTEKMSSLGELVAGILHEINNPLNFIHCNAIYAGEYMQQMLDILYLYREYGQGIPPEIQRRSDEIGLDFLQEDLPKVLQSMQTGTERISNIVQSLRSFSRLDESEVKTVDIHDGLESTLMLLGHRLRATPTHPTIHLIKQYGEIPLVECYAGELNQAFMNILANALDALESQYEENLGSRTGEEHPRITIKTEVIKAEESKTEAIAHEQTPWIAIHIRDNGTGMSQDTLSHLFDPFFTTKPVGKGTGLGLATSYQIITQKHGGKLYCHSEIGQGTEFIIELPISLSVAAFSGPVR
jgi:signal transduction histidine kinase